MKWIALLLFGGIGLAALIGGTVWGYQRYALQQEGLHATGVVVELYHSRGSYYPVVEFPAGDGKPAVRFRGSTGSGAPEYEVGAEVEVLYPAANPSDAQIADFEQFWLGPAAISLFGFLFLVAGVGSFLLVANSDKTFGPAFQQQINRARRAGPGRQR